MLSSTKEPRWYPPNFADASASPTAKINRRLRNASWSALRKECGGDQPPQYFFGAKMRLKTRGNSRFQGGKPPGSNARGNPRGPVRTHGDSRPLLGLFATSFVVVPNNFFGIFRRMDCNVQLPEVGPLLPTSGSWLQTSNLCFPKSNFQRLHFDLPLPTSGSWTREDGSGNRTSGSWKMEIVNRRMRRRPAASILFSRQNVSKNAGK